MTLCWCNVRLLSPRSRSSKPPVWCVRFHTSTSFSCTASAFTESKVRWNSKLSASQSEGTLRSGSSTSVRVHGSWCVTDIIVQEFVEYGALDLYLKRGRSVSVSWKLDVAKQLASVLNFLVSWMLWRLYYNNPPPTHPTILLSVNGHIVCFWNGLFVWIKLNFFCLLQEQNNIIHGNICAKNLLLAREGDPSKSIPPFIKLSDPGISVMMLGKDGKSWEGSLGSLSLWSESHVIAFLVAVDRIPWVAPEVLLSPDNLTLECDKWSFGATLWELFNNGNNPLLGWDLDMVPPWISRCNLSRMSMFLNIKMDI